MFVLGRITNGGRYCTPCSVLNVSVQSSLERGLVAKDFTSYALRSVKPERILLNTGRLLWPTRDDTKRWVFAQVAPKRLLELGIVESTTGWLRRDIIELRVEYRWVH